MISKVLHIDPNVIIQPPKTEKEERGSVILDILDPIEEDVTDYLGKKRTKKKV